jgi:MFS transporter, DHA1 family, inner membrane transport protein
LAISVSEEPVQVANSVGTSSPPVPDNTRALLLTLLFGNFVVGTGILLPAGMLTALASGLEVSVPKAGTLMLASGFIVALGAPLIAAFTSAIDRRRILLFSTALHAVAHVCAAIAPDFTSLMASRILLAISAAIYTPQAAATVGVLLPPDKRASAITMIFIGWSMATVGGMPLGGFIADTFGWRIAFALVAVISVIITLAIAVAVPRNVRIPKLSAASWTSVATSKALLLVLLVTVLNGTGQFTFFTYLNPSLKASLAAGTVLMTFVLAWYGVSATVGNVIAARFIARIGPARAAFRTLLAMAGGLFLWGAYPGVLAAVLLAASLWGLGTFATNSIQQARLAGLAPDLTSASIALNTSAIYLGQALGSGLGGHVISAGGLAYLPWLGSAILLSAVVTSRFAERYEIRDHSTAS